MQVPFYIVDVFAAQPLTGNPLAVVRLDCTTMLEGGANRQSHESLFQAIAREMNYSETTFILDTTSRESGYPVRIFTPEQELPFAGHPTLGTAYVLLKHILAQPQRQLTLNLAVGPISVTVEQQQGRELLWMRQNRPEFGQTLEITPFIEVLGLDADAFDIAWPIQEVSTGVPFLLVPLRRYADLDRIVINRAAYYRLIEPLATKAILVFCPETQSPEQQFAVRMFGEALGVAEDPATGSANGCLAAYLSQYQVLGEARVDIRVEQGAQLQRPSILHLRSHPSPAGIEVHVGGQVIPIAQGVLTL
ncbi:MAG: PhzF family phenazine biosynthesis protein [Cyanobacteria bacterium P01_G01_bin.54]